MTVMSADARSAILDMDITSSMGDGIAALIIVGNAMIEEEKTAEFKALIFVTEKLGEDVREIRAALESIRPPWLVIAPEPEKGGAS